jgi:hypothetical protein
MKFFIPARTVGTHRAHIMLELKLESRAELGPAPTDETASALTQDGCAVRCPA